MESLKFEVDQGQDVGKTLSEVFSLNIGSLAAGRKTWARVAEALGMDVYFEYLKTENSVSLQVAAEALVKEGDAHPYRATYVIDGNTVKFTTPGEVDVTLHAREKVVYIEMQFNRDSRYLSTCLLACLFSLNPSGASATQLAQACKDYADAGL